MNDHEPIFSDYQRALLDAGRAERVPDQLRERAYAALSAAGVTGGAAVASATGLGKLAKIGLALAVVGAASTGGYVAQRHSTSTHAAAPQRLVRAPSVSSAAPVAPPPSPSALTTNTPPPTSAPRGEPTRPGLSEELALIDGARTALARHDANVALRLLAQHQRHFPQSSFDVERDTMRVDALVQSGRGDDARRAAEQFLREHPASPQAERMRALAEE